MMSGLFLIDQGGAGYDRECGRGVIGRWRRILSPLPGRTAVVGIVYPRRRPGTGWPWAKGFGPCRGEGFDTGGGLSVSGSFLRRGRLFGAGSGAVFFDGQREPDDEAFDVLQGLGDVGVGARGVEETVGIPLHAVGGQQHHRRGWV